MLKCCRLTRCKLIKQEKWLNIFFSDFLFQILLFCWKALFVISHAIVIYDPKVTSSHSIIYENFTNYFLKTEVKSKDFIECKCIGESVRQRAATPESWPSLEKLWMELFITVRQIDHEKVWKMVFFWAVDKCYAFFV